MIEDDVKAPAFLEYTIKLIGVRTLLSVMLLLTILWCLSSSLGTSVREIDSGFMWLLSTLGVIFGWLLAKMRLRSLSAVWIAGITGIGGLLIVVGRLAQPLVLLVLRLRELSLEFLLWILYEELPLPDLTPTGVALGDLLNGLDAVLVRLYAWLNGIVLGKPISDPLITILVWGIVVWGASVWAAWFVRRHDQPIQGVTPAGVLLAVILYHQGNNPGILLIFLGAAFLLFVIVNHHARERYWDEQRLDYPSDIRIDVAVVVIPLVLLILCAAALAPSITIDRIKEFTRSLTESRTARIENVGESSRLSPERNEPLLPYQSIPSGLPRSHLLGTGSELSTRIVMRVRTGELPAGPPEVILSKPIPRHYWRSLTFSYYTGHGWMNPEVKTFHYRANATTRALEGYDPVGAWMSPPGYIPFEQEIQIVQDTGDMVYNAGSLVSVDQDFRVAWRVLPEFFTGEPGGGDIFGATVNAEKYRVKSLIPAVSQAKLNVAAGEYPQWVTNTYLSLPDIVPPRVISLALDITANASTPFERARLIEAYLRQIPYTLDVTPPPADRDVADYYLFDLKRGYCDYAATAMVVLSRAAGLPARLVMGYASGNYDSYRAEYAISEADAHSWPEIYFSGVGWVEFEPTGSYPQINLPQEEVESIRIFESRENVLPFNLSSERQMKILFTVGSTVLIMSLIVMLSLFGDLWILSRMSPSAVITRLYQRLYRRGRLLAATASRPSRPGDTPMEFSSSLTGQLINLPEKPVWKKAIQPALKDVMSLTNLYNNSTFSPRPPGEAERKIALQAWERLRWRLLLANWLYRRSQSKVKKR